MSTQRLRPLLRQAWPCIAGVRQGVPFTTATSDVLPVRTATPVTGPVAAGGPLPGLRGQAAALGGVGCRHASGGVAELFETGRKVGENVAIGRAWEAWELRHKSFNDLHALWYVLVKERNRLYSQKMMAKSQGQKMPQPHRIVLVKKSMCRIKQVLTERALAVEDADKQWFYRKVVNDM